MPDVGSAMGQLLELQKRVDQRKDPNIESARMEDSSASAVLSTLAPVALVAFIYFVAFLILRRYFPAYYSPRSFKGRTPAGGPKELTNNYFGWITQLFTIPDSEVLRTNSMDAYLLLRLLKMGSIACVVGALITWPVLLPVNITGGNGERQFNMLTLGNVNNKARFFAHAGCAWLFFLFLIFFITRETIYLINLRQAYILSDRIKDRISTRTVLFTSVPDEYLNHESMLAVLGAENVERMWFPTETKDLNEKWEERNKVAARLEGAEVAVIRQAVQKRNKYMDGAKGAKPPMDLERLGADAPLIAQWIEHKKRPTHRLKPLIGKKVDTIDFCRGEIATLNTEIETERLKHVKGEGVERCRSVFVLFTSIPAAYDAYQSVTHHLVAMTPRYIGITPSQVIWENLNIRGWERVMRRSASIAFAAALTIFWSIPVAFVASIANVDKLIELLPWLSFLNKLPAAIMGVVTGLLPVIAVAILISLVPFFFRMAARYGGAVSTTQVEITTNRMFFWFQVVQVFLVATLGSAAPAVVSAIIDQPSSAASLLAQNLPKASTFYLCWFILQGLGSVGGNLVSIVGLILQIVFSKFLWNTPRKLFLGGMPRALLLGSVYPPYTLLLIIAIVYSCIAPISLGFAAIALFLFWFVWRYNMLYNTGDSVDTRGHLYADTLQHLFVGIYIAEICLIGLFAISAGSSRVSLGPMIMMIILLIITILYHYNFSRTVSPLLAAMPRTLTMNPVGLPIGKTEQDASGKVPNPIVRFLRPTVHASVPKLARMVPEPIPGGVVRPDVENAYTPPCCRDDPFPIWLPDDRSALSGNESPRSDADADVAIHSNGKRVAAGAGGSGATSFARDEADGLIRSGACREDQVEVSNMVVVKRDGGLDLLPHRDEQMQRAYSMVMPTDSMW